MFQALKQLLANRLMPYGCMPAVIRHSRILAAEEMWSPSTKSLTCGCTESPRSKVNASWVRRSRSCHVPASFLLAGGCSPIPDPSAGHTNEVPSCPSHTCVSAAVLSSFPLLQKGKRYSLRQCVYRGIYPAGIDGCRQVQMGDVQHG